MSGSGRKKGKRAPLTPGERRRLRQLVVCLVLFGVVFLGRGTDWAPVAQLSQTVGELVRADTDFQAVFARMGESLSKGEPAVETFRSLWDGVFPQEEQKEQEDQEDTPAARPAPGDEEGGEDRGAEAS